MPGRLPERLDGSSTAIRRARPADAGALLALRIRNRDFLAPWDPRRDDAFFTLGAQRTMLADAARAWDEGRAYGFVVLDRSEGDRVIGQVTISNIVRSVWQNGTLGYWIDEASGGRGHATEAVRLITRFAFGPAELHRLMPAVIPRNVRSAAVLRKAGFRLEGRALRYLRINGVWEDHDLYALTAEEA